MGVPRGGGGRGGVWPRPTGDAPAGGGGGAARPARKQGRPGSPTCGAPTTITGGGVSLV
jgi:hypothetical protein